MAGRSRYLVTYDIADPRRLRDVHKVVVDFGDQLQYSVYLCDLTPLERVDLRSKLRTVMHRDEDCISIFDLGPPAGSVWSRVEHLGRAPDLPDDGHAVW